MQNKLMMFGFVAAFAMGCKKDAPSCDDVFAHTVELAPAELKPMLTNSKGKAMEKCSKLSDDAKRCAMAAKTMEELQKCPRE